MPYDGNRSDDKPVLPESWRGSTNLNSTIKSYEDLAYRVKVQLGYPVTDVEVSDQQMAIFIDEALEWFTLYAGTETKYLIFTDDDYVEGCGIKLDDLIRTESIKSECIASLSTEGVIGEEISYSSIESGNVDNVFRAYLSASPFQFPSPTDYSLSALGQDIILKFDKNNPWDANSICNADCFTIRPRGSDCVSLSSNANIPTIDFNVLIETYTDLVGLLDYPVISSDDDGILAVSALDCEILSAIPTEFYNTSAFYASADLVGFPVVACISIKNGQGVIRPSCVDSINSCLDLSAAWTIDPDFDWEVVGETLSGEDGRVITYSDLDLSTANSVIIPGIPVCSIDGSIKLNENNGRYATFYLCNSALDTGGNWELENVQFIKSYTPPEAVLNTKYCGIQNKGFTVVKSITANSECIPNTPDWIPVDVVFEETIVTELTGVIVEDIQSGFDEEMNHRRKISSVFSCDATMGAGGHFGANLLFSFEFGVVANAFGYDLQGNRNLYRNGYDLLSYHMARGFIDQVQQMVNYVSYEFNPDTQYLSITPEPYPNIASRRGYVIGVKLEKPLSHLINKKWVQEWVLARTMETLGYIRSKYGNVTLYGGSSIQGDTLISMATAEKERLLRELRDDLYYSEPPLFFIG